MAASSSGAPCVVNPHPALIGYLGHRLRLNRAQTLSGVIPTITPPSASSLSALSEAVQLATLHLLRLLRGHLTANRSTDADVQNTLRGLYAHSQPQDRQLRLDILQTLPDLSRAIRDLLLDPPFQPFGVEDAHALALAIWFKQSFMKWVDPVLCDKCGTECKGGSGVSPTNDEKTQGAGRVELHTCPKEGCGGVVRFPRYGNPVMLLKTKTGRCGEWAHLFYEILRAVGLRARYVWNGEDHVWNEYWSTTLEHWVHVDSCEATINKPLLYARGWGKKQAFCLAVGPEGAEDVTRYYVDDWEACRQRRRAKGWRESFLAQSILEITVKLRLGLSLESVKQAEERDMTHRLWVVDQAKRWSEAESMSLKGRTSGTMEWRAMRDELGERLNIDPPKYKVLHSIFSDSTFQAYTTLGDTEVSSTGASLTRQAGQTSAIFHPQTISQSDSFLVKLQFRMTAPPGSAGADGMALAFLSKPRMGAGGYGLGYSQAAANQGDFAVEFDTFQSWDFAADPEVPHIAVHSPPNAHHRFAIACSAPGSLPSLNDGQEHTLKLLYDGETRHLWGWLVLRNGEELLLWQTTIPLASAIMEKDEEGQVSKAESPEWFVGITGATGGLWQRQEVLGLSIELIKIERAVEDAM